MRGPLFHGEILSEHNKLPYIILHSNDFVNIGGAVICRYSFVKSFSGCGDGPRSRSELSEQDQLPEVSRS